MRPEKNHALFLETAALVRQQIPAARFVIVGDGPGRAGAWNSRRPNEGWAIRSGF